VRRIRVYVDTSVFGGTLDKEFSGPSIRFFQKVYAGKYTVLLSQQTMAELREAPEKVKEVINKLKDDLIEYVPIDDSVINLARLYIKEGVLSERFLGDAIHVAAATTAEAELILSWNFRHIVRYDKIKMFNGVNELNGYRSLDIRSPLEVDYEEE